MVTHGDGEDSLPFGPFDPGSQHTLEQGLRKWVGEQTQFDLGYTEQLYTFGDRGRHSGAGADSVRPGGFGGLSGIDPPKQGGRHALRSDTQWQGWYHYFPWEDWRKSKPRMLESLILPKLRSFVKSAASSQMMELRRDRVRLCFGADGVAWDEEKVLERYELLYEAGLVREYVRDNALKAGGMPAAIRWAPP